ncbi:hypothetical protein PVAND_007696 [Polypedilum vanderplanki]|uniref:Uncharacterized protein n=1 Tax=Polypedilum vanderplanki TaxID=319348 RepID=A0A9J6C805_POLVA|nr:hypothetical protein PVAND_007696 [Polypedilum vanderplanki]
MHQQLRFIFISSLLCLTTAAIAAESDVVEKEQPTVKLLTLDNDDVSNAELHFETSHKVPAQRNEFQTSHKISHDAFQRREDLHQSMRSKEKPELNEQLGELIAADIKNNIEAKRLSEYEKYVIEPLTTDKPKPLTTTETIAKSINEGLIDDFAMLEEAGTENKQQSRIQIKKGPNGQDYEYEYVYYYYDDDENKNPGDSDVIVSNRKSSTSTSTVAPSTTKASTSVSAGKASYASIERGSSGERNEIQSRGKGRAQALPAPVVEEINEERLPPATRFPQRGKSVSSAENTGAAPEGGKKHHPKRPSLELVDSHIFLTDEKDKNSQKGPRVFETELTKTELIETVSKSSIEYQSSTVEPAEDDDEEDTTQSMEKVAFDLYAHIENEKAKEEDKNADEVEATTIENDEETTLAEDLTSIAPSTTTTTTVRTTTTTTTEPTTTISTTTTTEAPLVKGRGGLTAGRNSNRFKFQGRTQATTEAATESTEAPKTGRNRFQKPSFGGPRAGASRSSKPTAAPVEEEEVKKEEAPAQQQSSVSKFRSSGGAARNRFSLRNNAASTEKPATAAASENNESESTTAKSLVRPRPQFSLRNRQRSGAAATTEASTNDASNDETPAVEKEEKATSIVPKPTSRLNINRPGNRAAIGQKSVLNRSRVNSNAENSDNNKSANENESDAETTTANNLNKLKSRPRIQINAESKAKKPTAAQPVINRKANPLISKRKFGVTSTTDATVDENDEHESDNATKDKEGAKEDGASEGSANELKEEDTTQAAEASTETPRGIGLLNRRKLVGNRRPGSIK